MSSVSRSLAHLRVPVPLPSPWFWALVVLYVFLGLVGHDPWKSDDAIGFGIAWSMAKGGASAWLMPSIAGQMVPEEGPLAFWLAALFIKLFGTLVQPHDAARLASAAWMTAAIIGVHRAARNLDGVAAGRLAVLVLLACLGLLVKTHEIAAEPAFLAGWAMVLWAMTIRNGRLPAFSTMAIGSAILLLARGPSPALPVVLVALFWIGRLCWTGERGRAGMLSAGLLAGATAVPLWWSGVDNQAFADAYIAWQRAQLGLPDLAALRYYGKTVLWYTFPAWPVALWWIGKRRPPRLLDVHPIPLVQTLPLVAVGVALASLAWSANAAESVLLPLLPPLALLVAPGLVFMRRGQAALIDWFGRITFSLVALLIWLGYAALIAGWPPRVAANFARLEPGFVAEMHWVTFAVAMAATLGWMVAVARSARTPLRGIVHWCYGTTLTWLLLMTLWLPWIDYGRSYRPVAASLRVELAGRPGGLEACLQAAPLGLAERASIAYFAGVRFGEMKENCPWLLAQGSRADEMPVPAGMRLVWEGHRPGDRSERFRLYMRGK